MTDHGINFIHRFCDGIDAPAQPKPQRRGIGLSKKKTILTIAGVALVAFTLTVSAGLLTMFGMFTVTVDVESAVLINGEPTPCEFTFDQGEHMAGDIWYTGPYNLTNLRDDAFYTINMCSGTGQGECYSIYHVNETFDRYQNCHINLEPEETFTFWLEHSINLTADPEDTYYVTLEFLPEEAGYI